MEKYTSFNTNNRITFINSIEFSSSSLETLLKNLGKDDFKYLSQEFDSKVLDLVKKKRFCPYEYMSNFEKFKEKFSWKEMFYGYLTNKKLVINLS